MVEPSTHLSSQNILKHIKIHLEVTMIKKTKTKTKNLVFLFNFFLTRIT